MLFDPDDRAPKEIRQYVTNLSIDQRGADSAAEMASVAAQNVTLISRRIWKRASAMRQRPAVRSSIDNMLWDPLATAITQ